MFRGSSQEACLRNEVKTVLGSELPVLGYILRQLVNTASVASPSWLRIYIHARVSLHRSNILIRLLTRRHFFLETTRR